MFLKTTCLSSILSFINKYQQRLLERSLPFRILISLWASLKGNFKDARYKTLVLEEIYWRYFFICTEKEESLEKFLEDLNKFHPNLKFTYEKSKEKIDFLDVVIKIKEGRVIADIYCKSTNGHQYLHYDSCHADHIKRSIIFSQTLQLKRICSEKNNLNVHVEDLKAWICYRGYPDQLIKEQVKRPSDSHQVMKIMAIK